MKSSRVGMLVTLFTLLHLESREARLLENDLFLGAAFDPQLNSVVGEAGKADDKTGIPCDEEVQPWKVTNHTKMLTFMFKEDPTDGVTLSGPTPKGSAAFHAEGLAKSEHRPGVGHMQVFNTSKSRQSEGAGHMQDGSKKQILKSTPSPGGGH